MLSIMPKRKHADLEEDSPSGLSHREDRKGDLQATRLRHKFERGSQLLCRALKTARGFERQKLGRRQKVAKQNDDQQALDRLEAEVQALKVGLGYFVSKAFVLTTDFPDRHWISLRQQKDICLSNLRRRNG